MCNSWALKFDTLVHGIYKKANQTLHAFGRLRPYLGNYKLKLLLSAVILSNFSYCLLIWLFYSKTANNEINRTHKRALRILYRDYKSTFEELLERDNTKKTTHTKNLQKLMVEVYKSFNHLIPEYIWEFVVKKDVQYNLRTKELCKLPSINSQRYALDSLSVRGSRLWNTIDDEIKLSPSLEIFKKKICSWDGMNCACFICY